MRLAPELSRLAEAKVDGAAPVVLARAARAERHGRGEAAWKGRTKL